MTLKEARQLRDEMKTRYGQNAVTQPCFGSAPGYFVQIRKGREPIMEFSSRPEWRKWMADLQRDCRHDPEIKAIVHRGRLARKQARERAIRPPRPLSPIERMVDQAIGFRPASK